MTVLILSWVFVSEIKMHDNLVIKYDCPALLYTAGAKTNKILPCIYFNESDNCVLVSEAVHLQALISRPAVSLIIHKVPEQNSSRFLVTYTV